MRECNELSADLQIWARAIFRSKPYRHSVSGQLADSLAYSHIRVIPFEKPAVGVGVVEAPRGTLFHHYETDARGVMTKCNLIVATQNNSARIAMSVDKAAKGLISKGQISDGLLNKIEMAFRAYDPCNACATHALGQMPLRVDIKDCTGTIIKTIKR